MDIVFENLGKPRFPDEFLGKLETLVKKGVNWIRIIPHVPPCREEDYAHGWFGRANDGTVRFFFDGDHLICGVDCEIVNLKTREPSFIMEKVYNLSRSRNVIRGYVDKRIEVPTAEQFYIERRDFNQISASELKSLNALRRSVAFAWDDSAPTDSILTTTIGVSAWDVDREDYIAPPYADILVDEMKKRGIELYFDGIKSVRHMQITTKPDGKMLCSTFVRKKDEDGKPINKLDNTFDLTNRTVQRPGSGRFERSRFLRDTHRMKELARSIQYAKYQF